MKSLASPIALLRAMYCTPNIVKHRQHVWYLVLSCSWSWFLTVVTTIRLQNIPRKPSVISRNTAVEALLEGEWQRQVGAFIVCVDTNIISTNLKINT